MEKRMNQTELLELLSSLKLDVEEYWILSSSALVLRGIYPDAGDLDIAVTDLGLEELKKNYQLKSKGNDWYEVTDKIECVCDGKKETLNYQPEKVGDYYLQNIEEYLTYLEMSTREKDKKRIPLIKQYMKQQNK